MQDLSRFPARPTLALCLTAAWFAALASLDESARLRADEPAAPAAARAATGRIDSTLDVSSLVDRLEAARARGDVPGLSAAVVVDGRLVWSGGVGLADIENQVPATGTTVYRIASISKPIAATAVMQQVEAGRVALDDLIQQYVPSFPEKEQGPITIRHLLTHTSGIRHYRPGEFLSRTRYDSLEEAIGIFRDDPLLFAPGDEYRYTSYGYNLLAGVVESASGQPFDVYLREHIFAPSGMSSACCERAEEIVPGRARCYVRQNGQIENAPYVDLSIKWAGGGIIASAEDLVRFDIALNQGRLLRPPTLDEMYTPATLNDGSTTSYALGWSITTDDEGRTWVAHSGGSTGSTTRLLRCPAEKLSVAVLANLQSCPVVAPTARNLASLVLGTASEAAAADDPAAGATQ